MKSRLGSGSITKSSGALRAVTRLFAGPISATASPATAASASPAAQMLSDQGARQLAEGRLELVAEFGVKEYDIAALVPIVTEAGGRFTAYSGADSLSERSSLATNRVLHDAFLDLLHSS